MHVKLNDAHTHGKTANYFNCLSRHYSLFKCAQHERERVCVLCVYCVCTVGVCAVCVCTVCVCCMCVCLSVCWATRQTHTSRCLHRHETFAKRHHHLSLSLPLTQPACLALSPLPLPLLHYICLFLTASLSVCLSLAFN